jgi:hypothetical protein
MADLGENRPSAGGDAKPGQLTRRMGLIAETEKDDMTATLILAISNPTPLCFATDWTAIRIFSSIDINCSINAASFLR